MTLFADIYAHRSRILGHLRVRGIVGSCNICRRSRILGHLQEGVGVIIIRIMVTLGLGYNN